MKKRIISVLICLLLVLSALPLCAYSVAVPDVIEDGELLAYLILNDYDTDYDLAISSDELEDLYVLDITGLGVESLEGLQYATNLMVLEAGDNSISDLTPICCLSDLAVINLSNNALAGALPEDMESMIALENADLSNNAITSIDPLTALPALTYLDVTYNELTDVYELFGLTSIETLNARYNRFSLDPAGEDYMILSSLGDFGISVSYAPQLVPGVYEDSVITMDDLLEGALASNGVDLNGDLQISVCELGCFYGSLDLNGYDLTDLSGLQYAVNVDSIDLGNNTISDYAPITSLSGITILKAENNAVSDLSLILEFPNLETADFSGNNITTIPDLATLTNLANLDLSDNLISSVGISLAFNAFDTLNLSMNVLDDESELSGLFANTLDVTYNNLYSISPSDCPAVTTLIYEPQTPYEGSYRDVVAIPDSALKTILLAQPGINLNGDSDITKGELYAYSETLSLADSEVSDLTGLSYMMNLKILRIDNTDISDLTPVADMTRLETITGAGSSVTDLSPIMSMPNLKIINFSNCGISDISCIDSADLPRLETLNLFGNRITDASSIESLTTLKSLTLTDNALEDISFVSSLTSLTSLYLSGNKITDESPIYDLTTLKTLNIAYNRIEIPSGFSATMHSNNPSLTSLTYTPQYGICTIYFEDGSTLFTTEEVYTNEEYTLPAPPASTDIFRGWETDGVIYPAGTTFIATGDKVFTAAWTVVTDYNINISVTGSNFFELTVDGYDYGEQEDYRQQSETATVYTVTAVPDAGEFVYWKNANGKILSYEETYTFTVVSETELIAVFRQPYTTGNYVSFLTSFDQEFSRVFYLFDTPAESIELPTRTPPKFGYTFIGWTVDGRNALEGAALQSAIVAALQDGDVEVTPLYTKDDVYYSVTVNGGTGSGSFISSSTVEVNSNEAESGKKFAYWQNADGVTVSYLEEYRFIIVEDTVLTAVYVDESETVNTDLLIRITSKTYDSSAATASFIADRYVPDSYTLIQTGILITNYAETGTDEDAFVIGGAGVLKGTASQNDRIGSYMIMKTRVTPDDTWYARAYVVYTDANGAMAYAYSDIESIECR